jgi:signal transduction histidine kinase
MAQTAQRSAEERNSRIAFTDTQERPIAGRVDNPPGSYAIRLRSATGLPWTVYAMSLDSSDNANGFSFRSRLVMAGLFAIALLVLGGSYLIGRAVARELAVAKLQSDFVTAVSHEFRTPLTAMRQLSELLSKGRVLNDTVRQQYYEVLEHETARLHRLVEGLLKFGRMEAGAVRYQFEAVDMTALLRSLVEEFTPEADRRGHHIELNVEPAIPAARADREALGCVIWNLLDNAVKYSPGRDKVWLALSRENGSVAIRVRDEGVGIAHEDQLRVFQKFVRAEDAMKLGVQGAGIGLAVAHQIVATHGGEIKLDSKLGAGSTFTVFLPALDS